MAQARHKARTPTRQTARQSSRRKPEFIAAVRFRDGQVQLFSVHNAVDPLQARQMVFDEIDHVASVVVTWR